GWTTVIPTTRWLGLVVLAVLAIAGCGGAVEHLNGSGSGGNTPGPGGTAGPPPGSQGVTIAPIAVTLFAGTGAPPQECTGGTQVFVVTGNSPPFTLTADGGCLSASALT